MTNTMTNTLYTIENIGTGQKVHGYTIEQAAEVVQIDASDILFAIETEGEGTTVEHRVTQDPEQPNQHDIMIDPVAYANDMVSWNGGDRGAALAEFINAVQTDPTFALAPKSWVQDVAVAIAGCK